MGVQRRATVVGVLVGLALPGIAPAQPRGEAADSLPGVARVAHADSFARVAAATLSFGYGYTGGVLNTNEADAHYRAATAIAASVRPLPYLAVWLRYAGRYDKHVDLEEGSGRDDGWVADSKLGVRYVHPIAARVDVGVQGVLWFPSGGSPPSFNLDGTSATALGMVTFHPVPALELSANGGFRYDRSSRSVDQLDMLSRADRLALGVSDSDAVLTGVGASYGVGPVDLLAEGTWDILVGENRPTIGYSPMRFAAGARWRAGDSIQVQLTAGVSPSRIADFSSMTEIYRAEPRFESLLTVSYSYPEPKKAVGVGVDCVAHPHDARCPDTAGAPAAPIRIRGTIVDEGGNPIPGARVTLTVRAPEAPDQPSTFETTTDDGGRFELTAPTASDEPLPSGPAELTVRADGYAPRTETIDVRPGAVVNEAVSLQEALPSGQLRGVIQTFAGTPLAATVEVEPGDEKTTATDDGSFELDLEPGTYQVEISAPGYVDQTRTVTVEENGVTIMNVDMRRK